MTDLDVLFATTPYVTTVPRALSIRLRANDANNRTDWITDEGFLAAFYRGEFVYCVRDYIHCETKVRHTLQSISFHLPPFEVIRGVETSRCLDLLCKGSDWWAVVAIRESSIVVEFGVDTLEGGRELATRFHKGLATREVPRESVTYEVWSGADFPSKKSFEDVAWETIKDNYPVSTRENLERLVGHTRTRFSTNARLILFYGPPGTGKTFAIRALLTRYKAWAQAALVLDPENLLSSPSYLLNILDRPSTDSTRFLVIEDADEIAEKNGTRGSGMSRFLNVVDGIIGSDTDVMCLLSTNASPRTLDPALTRPGRCLAAVGFEPFPIKEANERLGEFGPSSGPLTLAEIYRQLDETSILTPEQPVMTGQYL
jgi:hypothetical protein